ncbi:MAG: hypothetical protein ABI224_00190 [Acetobacteraceae bacterium]
MKAPADSRLVSRPKEMDFSDNGNIGIEITKSDYVQTFPEKNTSHGPATNMLGSPHSSDLEAPADRDYL